jgi:hypothetical protein
LDPQWFAWRPGNFASECFEGWVLFLVGERSETLTSLTIIVNEGLAVPHQFLSFALLVLTRLVLCEKPLPPHLNFNFIPLKLFWVNVNSLPSKKGLRYRACPTLLAGPATGQPIDRG